MPRPNHGPYLRKDPRTGVFYIHWTEDGRSRRISTRTRHAQAAKQALGLFLLEEKKAADPAGVTVADAWETYWREHVERRVTDTERLEYAWKPLQPVFADRQIRDLDPQDFLAYVEARSLNVSPSTVRRELSALTAAINHLVRTKRLRPEEVPFIPLPDKAPPKDRWLDEEEIDALLATAAAKRRGSRLSRTERFIHIALATGARKRVIETLEWSQVDFDRGLIDFNNGRRQTKKRKPIVPISARLRPVLRRAWNERKGGTYVLDNPGKVRRGFETVTKAAGLEGVTPHVLRHTFATQAAMAGVPLVDIARVLGNSVAMVERVYGKWAPEYLRSAVDFEPVKLKEVG